MFNIVLVEPEIPPNTGNIGRLCLATGSTLHLIEPLGFALDDRALKRAGLDYWQEVNVKIWSNWETFVEAQPEASIYYYLTTKGSKLYWDAQFQRGNYLVFGRETRGLPESLLNANASACLRIPMEGTRSLNLATAVGVVLYEGMRQVVGG